MLLLLQMNMIKVRAVFKGRGLRFNPEMLEKI